MKERLPGMSHLGHLQHAEVVDSDGEHDAGPDRTGLPPPPVVG
ncbi:hypothetical protein [Nocardioides sp.]